ncbi:MAG: glycosyltransferase [Bacteroidales bacterium]|nr:glycosyltransferase [Bacteroidales bacterium]
MKVGLFVDTYYPMVDGVINVVHNYAKRLVSKCDVTVYCPGFKDYDIEEDKKYTYPIVRCYSLPLSRLDYSLPIPVLDAKFDLSLIRDNLDIVHIHSPFTVGLVGLNYAKITNKPLIATLHSQYKQDLERNIKIYPLVDVAMFGIMSIFNACDECWTVNAEIKKLYENEYGLTSPCKIRPNATEHVPVKDKLVSDALINRKYGISDDEIVLLFVGRINLIKNLDFLVRSLAKVKEMDVKFKMLFVGQGQDEKTLSETITSLNLQNEVIMCGLVTDKFELESIYSRAKLFLFPSLYDANSLVQIEAACQGTPTVFIEGAKTAGSVTDNVNGFIAEPNEESYALKIKEILSNAELYDKVSTGAKRDLYITWDDVVNDVYNDYCKKIQI